MSRATIIRGNALSLPLADDTVDLIVTSPPYFGLRSYQDAGEHYAGQLGSELTPAEFVDALIAATAEMVRVLKPSGSIWVNLGDKYSSSTTPGAQSQNTRRTGGRHKGVENIAQRRLVSGVPAKSLMGIPWRYALRCIDDLGLILRAEVIWSKPNGLPESVTDRVRRSHETWFHFTRKPRYYSAVDEIREGFGRPPTRSERLNGTSTTIGPADGAEGAFNRCHDWVPGPNPLGKLPCSVWTIPTQPLTVPASLGIDHFAAFPMEWPRRIIRGWSPSGVCTRCGEGRRPVSDVTYEKSADDRRHRLGASKTDAVGIGTTHGNGTAGLGRLTNIIGYVCDCPDTTAPTTPGVVLDPFGGTGTTALVASALGRHGISVDMSADYCRLATWRTSDPGQRAAAMQVDKPEPVMSGQDAFDFDGLSA